MAATLIWRAIEASRTLVSAFALEYLLIGLATLWVGVLYAPVHHGSVVLHAIVMTLGGTLVGLAHVVNLRLNHWHIHDASCAH